LSLELRAVLKTPVEQRDIDAIKRLRVNTDFKMVYLLLRGNLPHLAEQAVKSQGVTSDEHSGAWKLLDEIITLFDLAEYREPGEVDRRFE
jgi:hypothetical protein